MQLKRLKAPDYPLSLLHLADPDYEQIAKYLATSQVYGLYQASQLVGVCVLQIKTKEVAEIMNLAIQSELQGKGLGRYLLKQIISKAKAQQIKQLEIATGNSSIGQLHLYESVGFQRFATIPNYFVEHYPEPIYEHGIQCTDQIWLKQTLS